MRTLVTGGAGFIGSHLVEALLAEGHEVTVLDNFSEGKAAYLPLGDKKLHVVEGDVRDFHLVQELMEEKDWVFHLAAMSRIQPSITDPVLAFSQNMLGTAHVLEAARQAGVRRVVYSASSSAYGRANTPPLRESMPTDCLNPYSLSKKAGEEMAALYHKLYGLSTVSLRYFNVYGPRHQETGDYATVIAIFRKQRRLGQSMTIVGTGEQRRDFTYVSDVVRANLLAAGRPDAHGTINIGTGWRNYSINEVAEIIGGPALYLPLRKGEADVTLADVSLAQELLGWEPEVPLAEGLALLDRYEKSHPA